MASDLYIGRLFLSYQSEGVARECVVLDFTELPVLQNLDQHEFVCT